MNQRKRAFFNLVIPAMLSFVIAATSVNCMKNSIKPDPTLTDNTAATQAQHQAPDGKTADGDETFPIQYPSTRRDESVVDHYHGTAVADPYRWLEDTYSTETSAWMDAQNQVTQQYLDQISQRDSLRNRLEALWNFERWSTPIRCGDRYFFTYNSGLQNQALLMVMDRFNGKERLLLDPNTLSQDGTVALTGYYPSPNGQYLAYALSSAGSDWKTWKIRSVDTGQDLEDTIQWSKFSGASWSKDSSGFFYSGYDAPAEGAEYSELSHFQKLKYHKLGTPAQSDPVIYERKDHKEWGFDGYVTEDGNYLAINVSIGTDRNTAFLYKEINSQTPKQGSIAGTSTNTVELLPNFDAAWEFLGNVGQVFYFKTSRDAPNSRIITIDITAPDQKNWKEIIAEDEHNPLEYALITGNYLVCSYMDKARSILKVHNLKYGDFVREIQFNSMAAITGLHGRIDSDELLYAYTSFTSPAIINRINLGSDETELFRKPKLLFEPDQYQTKQVFYKSKDGTTISMFLSWKNDSAQISDNKLCSDKGSCPKRPVYLTGYGGFNIPLKPSFSVTNLAWMEMGGILAIPNLRGGGEYGRDWHLAGTKLTKQNVFDDFIGAAEWLIEEGITVPEKLAIGGGSNGGLLVGACMLQRPELFAVALPAVGVMDMLRYHLFTIGWAWASDYGTVEDPEEFKALYAYSPLHNIKQGGNYPATLVTTGDHDDRVVPGHSLKFGATLQQAQIANGAPILIRIERKAGHGAGKPTALAIAEAADRLAFMGDRIGMF